MRARSAMLPVLAAGLLLAVSAAPRATSSAVQLLEVRTRQQAGRVAVVLEASAPVAYTSSQPDPFTVVLDLRHVVTSATVNRLAREGAGPVSSVRLEQATAADGADVARVFVGLAAPARAAVQSARNEIAIEFPDAEAPSAAPGARTAVPPAGGAATELVSVVSEKVDGRARVRLRGNGALTPKSIEEARDLPPRLVIDLPGVAARVPSVLPVGGTDLARIRIAANSREPLVTRVVLDLTRKVPYRVERDGQEIVIDLGDAPNVAAAPAAPASPAAPVAVPPAAAPAVPEPAVAALPAAPAPVAEAPMAHAAVTPAPEIVPVRDPEPAPAAPAVVPAPVATGTSGSLANAAPVAQAPVVATAAPTPAATAAPTPAATLAAAVGNARSATQARSSNAAQAADVKVGAGATPALQAASGEAPKQFSGHPVSLDFEGVDLRAVLRTFAEITGLNIVIDPAVQGTVDVALRDVPWDQALDIILRANQLGYAVDGTIVRIAPLAVLADEEGAKRKLAEERALSGELQVMTRPLNYSKATTIEPLLKNVLSSRGKTAFDLRTNTLIVYDLPEYLQKVSSLVEILDQPELQVEIEARIIQTDSTFARELGIQWGFNGLVAPELGNTTNMAFPNSGSLFGATGGLTGLQGLNPSSTGVNLGVANPTSAAGITLGSINGAFRLSAELSALERAGKIRTLLTPRVVTQNNIKATITRGQEIPYSTITSTSSTGGSLLVPTVQFRTAALVLNVTPHITGANTVILEVDVDNGSPGEVQQNGNVAINTQRAQTTVLVVDGATTVIGGIQTAREADVNRRTPGLWKLPVLGYLFRNDSKVETNEELLIFITPRIVRMPTAAVSAAPASAQQ